jgi:hypothetical protein
VYRPDSGEILYSVENGISEDLIALNIKLCAYIQLHVGVTLGRADVLFIVRKIISRVIP